MQRQDEIQDLKTVVLGECVDSLNEFAYHHIETNPFSNKRDYPIQLFEWERFYFAY